MIDLHTHRFRSFRNIFWSHTYKLQIPGSSVHTIVHKFKLMWGVAKPLSKKKTQTVTFNWEEIGFGWSQSTQESSKHSCWNKIHTFTWTLSNAKKSGQISNQTPACLFDGYQMHLVKVTFAKGYLTKPNFNPVMNWENPKWIHNDELYNDSATPTVSTDVHCWFYHASWPQPTALQSVFDTANANSTFFSNTSAGACIMYPRALLKQSVLSSFLTNSAVLSTSMHVLLIWLTQWLQENLYT